MPKKIYKEINLNEKMFGSNFVVYDWIETDTTIDIFIKSKKQINTCPKCGCKTEKLHNTYNRRVQILPIKMKETFVNIKSYKYKCTNENCEQKVIMGNIDFVSSSQVKSNDLICTILGVSAFLSNEGASKVLKLLGIKCSNDTIKRLYDHLIIEDDSNVEEIGVDDIAKRKGQTYATAIYDMKDHHLLALLDGRDGKTFKEWLENHPKITKVTRDRASSYATAISQVLPNCVQIADRFHMLENLLTYLKEIFKNELPKEIVIQDGKIMDNPAKLFAPNKSEQETLEQLNYDNNVPVDENGEVIKFDSSLSYKTNKKYKKYAENRKKKQQLIREMREYAAALEDKEAQINLTSKHFKKNWQTTKKYLNMSEEEIDKLSESSGRNTHKKPAGAAPYFNMIYKMIKDGWSQKIIYWYVKKQGFSGTEDQLKGAIQCIAKNNFNITFGRLHKHYVYDKNSIVIRRNDLMLEITAKSPKYKHNVTIQKNLELIENKYPIVKEVREIFDSFHSTIMGDCPENLDVFIDKYTIKEDETNDSLRYKSYISPFINGLKKDIVPAKNGISYPESSGFVEGNNNKLKLIKRILYGKANLVNLFRKAYLCFSFKRVDFNLRSSYSLIR